MANSILKAAYLGIVAGSRSMSAPALVSRHLAQAQPARLTHPRLRWLASPKTATLLKLLALGELIGDKLPATPSRLAPGPLVFRALSGGLSGAALCAQEEEQIGTGAVIGGLAALLSAYGFYHLRQFAGKKLKLPDPLVGAAEDTAILLLGWNALKK